MIYWELFKAFFKIGLISFGGGYAAMTPIYEQVVTQKAWLTAQEFSDLIAISQMTPGPIALNSATFVGLQIAGVKGAIVATIGNVIPSLIVVGVLAFIYFKFTSVKVIKNVIYYLQPVVIGMITVAAISLTKSAFKQVDINYYNIMLFLIALVLLNKTKLSPVAIMLVVGAAGLATVI